MPNDEDDYLDYFSSQEKDELGYLFYETLADAYSPIYSGEDINNHFSNTFDTNKLEYVSYQLSLGDKGVKIIKVAECKVLEIKVNDNCEIAFLIRHNSTMQNGVLKIIQGISESTTHFYKYDLNDRQPLSNAKFSIMNDIIVALKLLQSPTPTCPVYIGIF
jgi:hypothetical protein